MPRRTAEDAEKTKKKLLLTALQCFLEVGYSQAKLEDIAARAGLSRGALYWHFDQGKPQLYAELLADAGEGLANVFNSVAEQPLAGADKVSRFYLCWAELMQNDAYYRQTVELMLFKTELAPELEQGMSQKRESIVAFEGQVSHWLRSSGYQDPNLPRLLVASAWGLMAHWLMLDRCFDLHEQMQCLLTQFLPKGEK